MRVLVTGGAGYIGSHILKDLEKHHDVESLDNFSTGNRSALRGIINYTIDLEDRESVNRLFSNRKFDAVIHTAASAIVNESVREPLRYYRNNVTSMINLLGSCKQNGCNHFIFSSSAAVYGELDRVPIREEDPKKPINPYGWSKLMCEQILADAARADKRLRYVNLRYFNVAGADPEGEIGQGDKVLTHLIKLAAQAAAGKKKNITVFGTNYDTRDGTCERDYVHVSDLAAAHHSALDYLVNNQQSNTFNVGYGKGYTVHEVLSTMQNLANLEVLEGYRRGGDPSRLIADNTKIRSMLNWEPRHDSLIEICQSALEWEKKTCGTNI